MTGYNDKVDGQAFKDSFIEWYCQQFRPDRYLEIGAQTGQLIEKLVPWCGRLLGIDIVEGERWAELQRTYKNVGLIQADSAELLPTWFMGDWGPPDLIFIDGDHRKEAVLRDIINSLPLLAPYGVILVHDTWPPDEAHTVDFHCSSAHEAIETIRHCVSDVDVFTFHAMYGLTMIRQRVRQVG